MFPSCPEPSLDPPEYPDPPEPEGPCEECGQEAWDEGEDGSYPDEWVFQCTATVACETCKGTGVVNGGEKTQPEVVLDKIAGEKCPDCENGKVACDGRQTISPPEPPEYERDRE